MEGKFANNAADCTRGGGLIGTQSFRAAAEESQQLSGYHAGDGKPLVGQLPKAGKLDRDVIPVQSFGRNVGSYNELSSAQLLAPDLAQQIDLISPAQRMRREKYDEEPAVLQGAHRAMPEPQTGFSHCKNAAVRHLEHLEGDFSRGP